MAEAVITTTGITKYFGRHCAVNEVSFSVPRGSVTAFLGRNGSGKSTTLRMLLGFLHPTRGSSPTLPPPSPPIPPPPRPRLPNHPPRRPRQDRLPRRKPPRHRLDVRHPIRRLPVRLLPQLEP